MSSTVLTSVLQTDPSDVRVRQNVSPAALDVMDIVIVLTAVMSSTVLEYVGLENTHMNVTMENVFIIADIVTE